MFTLHLGTRLVVHNVVKSRAAVVHLKLDGTVAAVFHVECPVVLSNRSHLPAPHTVVVHSKHVDVCRKRLVRGAGTLVEVVLLHRHLYVLFFAAQLIVARTNVVTCTLCTSKATRPHATTQTLAPAIQCNDNACFGAPRLARRGRAATQALHGSWAPSLLAGSPRPRASSSPTRFSRCR